MSPKIKEVNDQSKFMGCVHFYTYPCTSSLKIKWFDLATMLNTWRRALGTYNPRNFRLIQYLRLAKNNWLKLRLSVQGPIILINTSTVLQS